MPFALKNLVHDLAVYMTVKPIENVVSNTALLPLGRKNISPLHITNQGKMHLICIGVMFRFVQYLCTEIARPRLKHAVSACNPYFYNGQGSA